MMSAVESFMKARGIEVDIKITGDTGPSRNGHGGVEASGSLSRDAASFAKEACAAGSEGIIAVGGDGTLQEIATGMLDGCNRCETPLGLIPCGSGNDWKRSFKNGPGDSIETCLQAMLDGHTKEIDAIRVNGMACLNIANIGLDAMIVRNARPFKQIFGEKSYVISAVISILRHKNIAVKVHIDGAEYPDGSFTLAAACNGQYYGGGMRISPSAVMDDGFITLCLVKPRGKLKTLALFPVMLLERHTGLRAISYIKCKSVALVPENDVMLCLDGNLYDWAGELRFELLPGAVRVFGG
jgi:YegS/Rv2252/BmrU family lipid kinase